MLTRTSSYSQWFPYLTKYEINSALARSHLGVVHDYGLAEEQAKTVSAADKPIIDIKEVFLGPKAENAEWIERLLLRVFREDVYWRRNYHPEDVPVMQPEEQLGLGSQTFMAHFQHELLTLLRELKSNIPFYSPRYFGHMLSDVSLPALLAYFGTIALQP